MAATDIVIIGASYAIGYSVEVAIGGLDCGAITVASDGSVTVPLANIPIPTGFTDAGSYLKTLDVGPYDTTTYGDATCAITMQVGSSGRATMYLPVYIGFTYPSIGQPLRPTNQQQTKSQTGGSTGKLRRVWSVAALLTQSQGLQFGTSASNLLPANFQYDNETYYQNFTLFNGVWYMDLNSDHDFDGMPFWANETIYPVVLNSLTAFTEIEERE